jgi:hypothetical protein
MSPSNWIDLLKDLGAPYALLAATLYGLYLLANRLVSWAIGDGSQQQRGEITTFLRRHIDAIEKIASRQERLVESMAQLGIRQEQMEDAQQLVATRMEMLLARTAADELFRPT